MIKIYVTSAKELSLVAKKKIEDAFSKKHNEAPVFFFFLDPSLIGGVLIKDGEKYYDASVRGRLATVKHELK